MVKKALELAKKAHAGQVDKAGIDYINHPLHVASQFDESILKTIALLHDVLEDSDLNENDLKQAGIAEEAIEAVKVLTYEPGEDYFEYIKRIKKHQLACRVKIEDLKHNSDLARIKEPKEKDFRRNMAYQQALAYLVSDLEN